MKHWKLVLEIQRFNDGFSLKRISVGDNLLIHRGTAEEIRQVINDNLLSELQKVEDEINPPEE